MTQPPRPSGASAARNLATGAPLTTSNHPYALWTARPANLALVTRIRENIAAQMGSAHAHMTPPGPHDLVVLLRGMPVAPWIPLRAPADVWATWLAQLERMWAEWNTANSAASLEDKSVRARWDGWRDEHVVPLQMRRVSGGIQQLITLLERQAAAHEGAHLVGHSVGGATVLAYLAALRAGRLPSPPLRLRAAITLDAAVTGMAGVWSGAKRSLLEPASKGLNGLGAWAAQQGVALVTASNGWDVWSHRQLADLPYIALKPEQLQGLWRQLDGTIHGWLRRAPHLVEALWGSPSDRAEKSLATSRSQVHGLLGQDSNL